jgi:hypothetical protein
MCALIRSSAPQQSCQACAEKGERGDAKGAIGKSWMRGWRITCRVCGGGLTDDDDPQMAHASAERFSDYWDLALDGESLFETMRQRSMRPGRRRYRLQFFYVFRAGLAPENYPTATEFPGC